MDPPTYPFEETSFMNGPLLKGVNFDAKIVADRNAAPTLNFCKQLNFNQVHS